jgi:integrase
MAAFKDKERNTWFCQFYYTNWKGEKKQKKKRGFRTKREALLWEEEFKHSLAADMDMLLSDFVEVYFKDKDKELKERSKAGKRYLIERYVTPYLGYKKMNEITPADIIGWQNTIREKDFSPTYLRMIQNQMTALFNHACKIYDLKNNPCNKVKKMGKSEADRLEFWTKEEYDRFIEGFALDDRYRVMFEILFWTGCREGELLALEKKDIDMEKGLIRITKTFYRLKGEPTITKPKTEHSIRQVYIPKFLKEEIKSYLEKSEIKEGERIFPISAEALQHKLKKYATKAGVKRIRVHDLRHSHVAFLIQQGVKPLVIKERLGHKDIKMTLNIYGHLYPDEQSELAKMLDEVR